MSGAAGIAAAKNRRSKPDPNQKPIISCSSLKPGSCPLPPGSKPGLKATTMNAVFDEESLQITGPMHVMQVLKVHEQRLNKMDDKLNQQLFAASDCLLSSACILPAAADGVPPGCDAECDDRISALEEKVHMLEEVIMNLQLTLTNVQSFAMETSWALMKMQNQVSVCPSPAAPASPTIVAPAPLCLADADPVD